MVQEIAQKIIATAKEKKLRISILSPRKSPMSFTCGLETNDVKLTPMSLMF